MADPSSARAHLCPTVLVGLGRFGAAVAGRIADERAEALRLVGADPADDDLRRILVDGEAAAIDPASIADAVLVAARKVLGHARVSRARDASDEEGIARLHVLVFADLGEAGVRAAIRSVLAAIEGALLGRLGPIFEAFRTGSARGAAIVPLLTMPHPPAHPEGAAIAGEVRALLRAVAATPPERRAIPQVFVLEDVAECSVLAEGELAQCLRNFASLLLYADDYTLVSELIHGTDLREPLATFVCATAELPRARLRAYGASRVALEALAAVRDAPRTAIDLRELDALEDVEVAELSRADEADRDVAAVLERYAPDRTREPPPSWVEEGTALLQRYGPDDGDRSLDAPIPPADPPSGWIRERIRAIQETWRLLQRRRFDDVVARDRAAIEAWRDRLRSRLQARVDQSLWKDPSPSNFRRSEEIIDKLQRAFGEQLDRAIAERDASTPARAPSFDELRRAHAEVLDAARQKPELAVMALWGGLALVGFALFLAPVLRLGADALSLSPGTGWYLVLHEHAGITAAVIGLAIVAGVCGYHLARAQMAITRALDGLWAALERTITGRSGSLHDYFASRLRLARNIARVEVLLTIRAALEDDAERLVLADKAARRAQAILSEEQRALGVRDGGGDDDLAGLLGRPDEALIESLVGPEGAHAIAGALDPTARQARIADVLATLGEHYGRAGRWREEVPFADVERLRRAAARHAESIATWDPFGDARRAEATAKSLGAFLRRQRRTLRGALNFTGYEDLDPTGVRRVFRGEAILPSGGHDLVREVLMDEATPVATRRGHEDDRAYYLLVASGIHEDAVASLRVAEAERSPINDVPERSARRLAASLPGPGGRRGAAEEVAEEGRSSPADAARETSSEGQVSGDMAEKTASRAAGGESMARLFASLSPGKRGGAGEGDR